MDHPPSAGDPAERADALRLGAATCGLLILELATIRWVGAQVRLFGFFPNIILIASFLGMGLGVGLGRRRPQLVHLALPWLLVLLLVLTSAGPLGLTTLSFPDPSLFMWGMAKAREGAAGFALATGAVVLLFWLVVAVFTACAAPVGYLFGRMAPLRAYGWDLGGSLVGVVVMSALSLGGLPPAAWYAAGMLPMLWLSPRLTSFAAAAGGLALVVMGTGAATFSPYNRLDLVTDPVGDGLEAGDLILRANHDFHQAMFNLSPGVLDRSRPESVRHGLRVGYELPFRVAERRERALIVGAGTGNDVMAALRVGLQQVVSVEIDPKILEFGRRLHPEQPYSDPRVVAVNTDARAYFEQHRDERFDVVAYGLLDSHSVFSAMSSLRLDNYVYTVDGVRAAWRLVRDDGVLALSFWVARPWLRERLRGVVREATGLEPVIVDAAHGGTVLFAGRGMKPEDVPPGVGTVSYTPEAPVTLALPTDDWPFLYLSPGSVPWAYLAVLSVLLVTATVAVRAVFRPARGGPTFDARMFLLGLGFMLLEARMVTALSLLFGSTWIVNSCVFGGILTVVLLANVGVALRPPRALGRWFVPLFASLALVAWLDVGVLNNLSMLGRGVVGGLVFALPVGFAGVVFSMLLRRSPDPAASLGSNLLGAVVGGVLEYASMGLGLRGLVLLAAVAYAGVALLTARRRAAEGAAPA